MQKKSWIFTDWTDMWQVRNGHFSTSFSRAWAQKRWMCERDSTNHQFLVLLCFSLFYTWMSGGIYPSPPCTTNMDGHNSESESGQAGWQNHQRRWNIRNVQRVFVQYKKPKIMLVGRRTFLWTFAIHLIQHQKYEIWSCFSSFTRFHLQKFKP